MKVAVVGTGVIGASWTTLFLTHGHEVVASDPAPAAEERLRAAVTADQGRLSFTPDLAEAVADAGFVQENGPERLELKDDVFAVLDAASPPATILASSSSGLLRRGSSRPAQPIPNGSSWGIRSTRPTSSRWSRSCRASGPARLPSKRPWASTAAWATIRSGCAGNCPAMSRTGSRPRCGGRHTPSSSAARRASPTSTRPSPTAPACAGRCSGPSSTNTSRAVRAASRTSWSTSAHPWRSGGPTDLGSPLLTPELTRAIAEGVSDELAGTPKADLVAERDALLSLLLDAKNRTDHL